MNGIFKDIEKTIWNTIDENDINYQKTRRYDDSFNFIFQTTSDIIFALHNFNPNYYVDKILSEVIRGKRHPPINKTLDNKKIQHVEEENDADDENNDDDSDMDDDNNSEIDTLIFDDNELNDINNISISVNQQTFNNSIDLSHISFDMENANQVEISVDDNIVITNKHNPVSNITIKEHIDVNIDTDTGTVTSETTISQTNTLHSQKTKTEIDINVENKTPTTELIVPINDKYVLKEEIMYDKQNDKVVIDGKLLTSNKKNHPETEINIKTSDPQDTDIKPYFNIKSSKNPQIEKYLPWKKDDENYAPYTFSQEYANCTLEELRNRPQPVQRTLEWYKYRYGMLTASDLHKVETLGKRNSLLKEKAKPFEMRRRGRPPSGPLYHGVKYEEVATMIYEARNNVKILEFGCIQHKTLPIFGASPDGICDENSGPLSGRMLEIKCPYSRKITGIVPPYYWAQVQGQLEVCELYECDFFECKLVEYEDKEDYEADGGESRTAKGKEKGVIITMYDTTKNCEIHHYCPILKGKKFEDDWIDEKTDGILSNDDTIFVNISFWKLEVASCVLVRRNMIWFEKIKQDIKDFWKDVLHYREVGVDKIPIRKIKKKVKMKVKCILDTDSESSTEDDRGNESDVSSGMSMILSSDMDSEDDKKYLDVVLPLYDSDFYCFSDIE
jgi:putative phage-type endonuclease